MTTLTAKQKREAREEQLRQEGADRVRQEMAAAGVAPIHDAAMAAIRETNADAMKAPGSVASATGDIAKPSVAGAKVIVACKIGVPYIDLQLCKMVEVDEQTQTGLRKRMQARRTGSVVRIRGTAYPRGAKPSEFPDPPLMADGAALNFGIDKDWFDQWLDQNSRSAFVTNHLIFAHGTEDGIRGQASEQKSILSGLEPINPKSDPRIRAFAKPNREEVSDVETRPRKAGADG
jgi:hypothetical protein